MAATFIVDGANTTVRMEWTAATALIQEIVGYAARYDWLRGLGPTIEENGETVQKPWGQLTNQEKLTMVFQAAQRLIIAQARTAYTNEAQNAARDTAAEYADENYQL